MAANLHLLCKAPDKNDFQKDAERRVGFIDLTDRSKTVSLLQSFFDCSSVV